MTAPATRRVIRTAGFLLVLSACAPSETDEPLAASLANDIQLPAQVRIVAARVARGATLASLLRAHDVAEQEVVALVTRAADVFDLRRFRAEQPYRLAKTQDGELRRFEYEIDRDRKLTVARAGEPAGFTAEISDIPKTTEVAVVRGAIDEGAPSLFAAIERSGEEVELSVLMAEVFASDIDFNTELQPGDRFELLVEKHFRAADDYGAGEDAGVGFAGYGVILAGRFANDGWQLHAVRFTTADGKAAYFDENGNSKRRFFLSSPLPFDPVITSRFTKSRLHPVLGVRRAHLGVDYRAATGTPVLAVADGTVVFAGTRGGSGRMVHLRHANGFETQYLHLSVIDVRRGERIAQGERVGRVGSTGLSTAPHLDYRLRQNGVWVNPVTAHRAMPPGDPVPESERAAFTQTRDAALARLSAAALTANND